MASLFLALFLAVPVPAGAAERLDPAADPATDTAAMKALFNGPLEVFLTIGELENHKPSLSNVRFESVSSVGGTRYYCFSDDRGKWYLEARMVFCIHVVAAK